MAIGYGYCPSQYAEIHGTEGLLRTEPAWNNENKVTVVEARFDGRRERYEFVEQDQFALQLRHIMDCLEQGISHRIQPRNSLNQMRVIDAVFESLESGNPVNLSEKG